MKKSASRTLFFYATLTNPSEAAEEIFCLFNKTWFSSASLPEPGETKPAPKKDRYHSFAVSFEQKSPLRVLYFCVKTEYQALAMLAQG